MVVTSIILEKSENTQNLMVENRLFSPKLEMVDPMVLLTRLKIAHVCATTPSTSTCLAYLQCTNDPTPPNIKHIPKPRCSMYGIFTYIYPKMAPMYVNIPYMEHLGKGPKMKKKTYWTMFLWGCLVWTGEGINYSGWWWFHGYLIYNQDNSWQFPHINHMLQFKPQCSRW